MQVLEKFKPRLAYKELDKTALEISRSAAAGNLGDGEDNYAEWAMITNDPLVVVNLVKTYITVQVSKLSGAPFRPENEKLLTIGAGIRLNSIFTDTYNDVLNDGYAFLGVGMSEGVPQVKPIDARYILYNGDEPTLRDATDVVVFDILPIDLDSEDHGAMLTPAFLGAYVDYDSSAERVKVSHYHKDKKRNIFVLDIYDKDPENPQTVPLPGLDRIPVVRFVGERVELNDKRYHYRGIYYQMASVLKALTLAGTKIQTRTAASDDDNYIVRSDAIANNNESWKNSGAKTVDNVDQNGNEIPQVQFVPHDNDFLMSAFNTWKDVISDMLGPTVASGSEAVTREEVIARNEVKDAISNTYLTRMANSIEEVYRCINMLMDGDSNKVVIVGGYIDSVKRQKDMQNVVSIYNYAKEAGLNTQGMVVEMLALTDLPKETKESIAKTFQQDPYKSPLVVQLQQQNAQSQQTIEALQRQIALLRMQATQRLERQAEFIDSNERIKRLEIAYKQWADEQKQTQEANMRLLEDFLSKGDYLGAASVIATIREQSNSLLSDPVLNNLANLNSPENMQSVQSALASTAQPIPAPQGQPQGQPMQPQQQPNPQQPMPPTLGRGPASMPKFGAAATLFNNA